MRPARRTTRILLATLAVLLAAAGCSASSDDSSDKAGDSAARDAAAEPVPADGNSLKHSVDGAVDDMSGSLSYAETAADRPGLGNSARKIIAQGDVELASDDVQATVTDVEHLVDHYFGEITERETTTNKKGDISDARLLLRIPVKDFDAAFVALQRVADLKSSNTGKEDVTTKVIDTKVRIRAQRLSLARVEALFERAQSISDIIRIESQVSRRQADLESLERRLNYLQNQTSMSTITVDISLTPESKAKTKDKKKPEETGFFAGLDDGWHALQTVGSHVATLSGRLLPFAGVLLIIGGPLWLVVRRFRRHDEGGPAPAPADA